MNLKIKKTKTDNRGITHFLVPFTVVLIVAIAGTFFLVSSHASEQTKRKKFRTYHYSSLDKAKFALAAADYWSHPIASDSVRKNPKAFAISDADCKPGEVRIRYVKDYKDNRVARTLDYSAFRLPKGSRGERTYNRKVYCTMTFNLAHQSSIPKKVQACVVFIHEYGHMIGHQHNLDIESPMYNGYVPGEGGSPESLYTSQYAVIEKTLCSQFWVGHFGNT